VLIRRSSPADVSTPRSPVLDWPNRIGVLAPGDRPGGPRGSSSNDKQVGPYCISFWAGWPRQAELGL
jgi:hypothetical protein